MEQHFLGAGKEARDSAEAAPEPQPPSIPSSQDSGPWRLPFYHILDPILEESSCHGGDVQGELLSSPCWRLRLVYSQNLLLPRAPGTLEPSPAPPTPGFWLETPNKPEAMVGDLDPAEEPDGLAFHQRTCARPSDGADRQQDAKTSDRRDLSDRS
nr:PREDICTED: annexin-2 receptor [Equus przewalskii]